MRTRLKLRRFKKGSALLAVILFVFVMALLTGSMLTYTTSERRANERTRLLLRARNMAENVAVYASEQLTVKLRRLRSQTPMAFMTGANEISKPPASVLETSFSTVNDVEVRAGLTGSTPFTYIDPANPANASNPNAGLQVSTSSVPIVAKATMRHPSIGALTAYAEQDLEIAMIPLFQFAVFYNMDMEFGPGPPMTISGPVHTNGNLIARIQTGMTNTLAFTDRVTAAGGFFANTAHKGPTYMAAGNMDNGPGGTGPLNFQSPSGTVTNINSGSTWRDHKWGTSAVTATTLNNFRGFASSAYAGYLRTSVHGVTTLDLPAIGGYKEVDDPATPEDDRKNGRQLIEPAATGDDAALKETKFARKAGLYIIVNPDDEDRVGRLPDATTVTMRARSYRAWLNTVNADLSHTLYEVILPGQPSYGPLNAYSNNLPNAYRKDTAVGHNQVLRIPKSDADLPDSGYATGNPTMGTFQDAFFYDMRRATNNTGFPFNRGSLPYTPRPIAKIDLDMTRFKMAVDRTLLDATTSTVYYPSLPTTAANWTTFIYNPAAAPSARGLGIGPNSDVFGSQDLVHVIQKSGGVLHPNRLAINGYSRSGTSTTTTAYAGRFIVWEFNGTTWTVLHQSTMSDESSITVTPTSAATMLLIRQYMAGNFLNMIDEQLIYVVDTSTGVRPTLLNNYHIVPSDSTPSAGANPVFLDAVAEVKIHINGVDDTANWNFSRGAVTGGVDGTFGTTANTLNRFTVNAMTSTTSGSVNLVATNKFTGAVVTQTMNLHKQSSFGSPVNTPARTMRSFVVTALPGADPFRIYFAPADPANPNIHTNPSTFAVAPTNLINTGTPHSPWFDGVTIYIHSIDAESKTRADAAPVDATHPPDRIDSGVRLWNGRGSLISLDGTTYPARTGFSFASNDAVYVVGHFNADGIVNSNQASTGTGGYSGRFPESDSEMLTAVMGDALTILSHPVFTDAGSNVYHQVNGWADSMSGHRRTEITSGYTSSWASQNPSSSNFLDGLNTTLRAARMPNLSNNTGSAGFTAAPTRTAKFQPSHTEVSTCLLTGIVPTTGSQTSGGVHNFPRLQEDWATGGPFALYIRGSMVAMFQSQVGTEPWSIRFYQGAVRNWGLHQSLRNANHDLPLEPIVLSAQRMRYRELTPTEYAAMKTTIEALPH